MRELSRTWSMICETVTRVDAGETGIPPDAGSRLASHLNIPLASTDENMS